MKQPKLPDVTMAHLKQVAHTLIDAEQFFGEDGLPCITDHNLLDKASEELSEKLVEVLNGEDVKSSVKALIFKYGEFVGEE